MFCNRWLALRQAAELDLKGSPDTPDHLDSKETEDLQVGVPSLCSADDSAKAVSYGKLAVKENTMQA